MRGLFGVLVVSRCSDDMIGRIYVFPGTNYSFLCEVDNTNNVCCFSVFSFYIWKSLCNVKIVAWTKQEIN